MEESLDLKEHLRKKQLEKDLAAVERIGDMLDGTPVNSVLNILSTLARAAVERMNEADREHSAIIFYNVMLMSDGDIEKRTPKVVKLDA